MEQKQLSLGAIIQIVASLLIFFSVFMAWVKPGPMADDEFEAYSLTKLASQTPYFYMKIAPWVVLLLSAGNIALLVLKRFKWLSIVLFLAVLAILIAFMHEFKGMGDYISFGGGLILAFFCILALLLGMFLDRKPKPANDVQPKQ